jgi:2'-5' RNA ligase
MKRIFVAVDISDEARRKVSEYIETLRKEFKDVRVSWDRAEKLHLTLKFLGDTNEKQLEDLKKNVENIASEITNFKLQISNTGLFPNVRNPRVLWLGIKGDVNDLQKINAVLEIECEKIGFAKEIRIYKPHLTIGRIREPKKAKSLAIKHLENKFEPIEFEVSEIVIYESKLQSNGSIYSVVSSSKLKFQT